MKFIKDIAWDAVALYTHCLIVVIVGLSVANITDSKAVITTAIIGANIASLPVPRAIRKLRRE